MVCKPYLEVINVFYYVAEILQEKYIKTIVYEERERDRERESFDQIFTLNIPQKITNYVDCIYIICTFK